MKSQYVLVKEPERNNVLVVSQAMSTAAAPAPLNTGSTGRRSDPTAPLTAKCVIARATSLTLEKTPQLPRRFDDPQRAVTWPVGRVL